MFRVDRIFQLNHVNLVTKKRDEMYANRQHDIGNGWLVFIFLERFDFYVSWHEMYVSRLEMYIPSFEIYIPSLGI